MGDRRGEWIQMTSGIAFWPADPREEEVRLEDIAHSLAMLCRFGGHCSDFYSVAEHSVHVSRLCSTPEIALWGLMHDASEAYLIDLPRPIKRMFPEYSFLEHDVMRAICDRFGLPHEMPAEVKRHDEAMLMCEAAALMTPPPMPWEESSVLAAATKLELWTPVQAKVFFLQEFVSIIDRL